MIPHWKQKFVTLWVGQALSILTSMVSQYALIWYLTDQTGSSAVLSAATIAALLPQGILSLFTGAFADRFDRRFLMAAADGAIGLLSLALALAAEGAKVGILDADIYGPSIPTMLGAENQRPTSPDGTHMAPIMSHGLATNSIGYLVTDDNAMVWRGPMASKALMQMLQETLWPDLDYLVLDMPPGTGDIQLTLAQNIPVTGAVVVTTPQDIALIDAKKGIVMFEKVEVPVLGIVENMSVHICSNCGHHEPIFGTGGAEKLAEKYHTQLLGQMPLHISLREDLDKGTPTVISRPESEFTAIYRQLADRVAAQLYWQGEVIPGEISFRAV